MPPDPIALTPRTLELIQPVEADDPILLRERTILFDPKNNSA
jgi:hypothetical protein